MNWTLQELLSSPVPPSCPNNWMAEVPFHLDSGLIALVEEKEKTIRKLTKKIEKLEDTLKKTLKDKQFREKKQNESGNEDMHLELLRAEI